VIPSLFDLSGACNMTLMLFMEGKQQALFGSWKENDRKIYD
jgi:hypothetical protein